MIKYILFWLILLIIFGYATMFVIKLCEWLSGGIKK